MIVSITVDEIDLKNYLQLLWKMYTISRCLYFVLFFLLTTSLFN